MDRITKQTITAYDKTVDAYIKNTDHLVQTAEMDYFVSQLEPGAQILDLGCGPGRDAKIFVQKGYQITGIDLSKNMILAAKKRCKQARFKVMDMTKLDFKAESFDAVWANASILNVSKKDAKRVVREIYRVLKKDGICYISVKKGWGEGIKHDIRYNLDKFYAFYSKKELEEMLKKIGFKILKSYINKELNVYTPVSFVIVFAKK